MPRPIEKYGYKSKKDYEESFGSKFLSLIIIIVFFIIIFGAVFLVLVGRARQMSGGIGF